MYDFSKAEQWLDHILTLGMPFCQLHVKQHHKTLLRTQRGPVDFHNRFFLYSCTKVMTCTAMLRLLEQGRAALSDPVSKFIPSYKEAFVMKSGVPCPPDREMTLHHLFTMTAGLDYDLSAPAIAEAAAKENASTLDIVSAFPKKALSFSPGERWQYSLCHDVLAGVIESITGLSFAEYIQKEIFDPLGMENTSFAADDRMAPQYALNWDTREIHPHTLTCDYRLAPGYFSGGAGIVSTLDDLSVFLDALACGKSADGYRLLKDETIRQMQKEQLSSIAKDPSFGCSSGPGYGYGLGVRTLVDNSQGQKSPLGEFGWDGAAGCYALCDPKNGLSIAFTTQVLGWVGVPGMSHAPIRDGVYEALSL